jgi:alpha-ketoglutarate-dependent taurine dioxygenase
MPARRTNTRTGKKDSTAARAREKSIAVRKLGVYLGAEIGNVDLRRPLTDAAFTALTAALVEHQVIVLRKQKITSEHLLAFGRRFGELSVHPFAPRESETPELIKFRNDESTPPFGTDVWHSDETFRAEPPTATILCAKEVPEIGGDTVFASMTAAFEGLSPRMRAFVAGLEAIHDIKVFKKIFGSSKEDRERLREYESRFPPATHPVVRVHPASGRKALFVNPNFTVAIKDMDEREGRLLLDTLFQQALVPEYQFRLHWEPDTIAIWDNRSVQHYAVHDYYPARRYMERVTIRGGPVVGVPAADPKEVRRAKFEPLPGADVYGGHRPQSGR